MKQRKRMPIATPPAGSWVRRGDQWACPSCGKRYPRRGQSHSCGDVSLEHHFRDRPRARELFDAFRGAVEEAGGPVRLSSAKTRIGFITGMTFAAVMPRKDYLRGHLVLTRRHDWPRFMRIDEVGSYWVHHFEIRDESDMDAAFRRFLRDACRVGSQLPSTRTGRRNWKTDAASGLSC